MFLSTRLAAIVGLMGLATGFANGDPIIDGRVTGADGYQYITSITPANNGTGIEAVESATLYLHQVADGGALSLAVVLPLAYVDNTYADQDVYSGGAMHTHPSWSNKPGGVAAFDKQSKRHSFKSLERSDKAEFTLSLGGQSINFSLDYIDSSADSATTGKEASGDLSLITANTSMYHNLNTYAAGNPSVLLRSPELLADIDNPGEFLYASADSAYDEWVYEAIYEFRVDADFFNGTDVLDSSGFVNGFEMMFDQLHASPSKNGKEDVFNSSLADNSFDKTVPEPGSIALLALGGVMVLGRPRRRRLG